jgi:septum formation protein
LEQLILASASPRRAQLLSQIGIPFKVVKNRYAEPEITAENALESIALAKAKSVSAEYPHSLILGADTVVICENQVLGKPKDEKEAQMMLRLLSGRVHRVATAIALTKGERETVSREETFVWMREIEEEEIKAYTASKEPYDKAVYAIQGKGAVFVEKVQGCFFNVVGLPLFRVVLMLKEWNISVW